VKGSELPQTLASMVPEVLWPTMLFKFQDKQLDELERKFHQDLMTRCRAAGITNFGEKKKQQPTFGRRGYDSDDLEFLSSPISNYLHARFYSDESDEYY